MSGVEWDDSDQEYQDDYDDIDFGDSSYQPPDLHFDSGTFANSFKVSQPLRSPNDSPPYKRQKYSVVCQTLSPTALSRLQEETSDRVASVTALPLNDAYILLQHFRWDEERLMERFFDNPEAALVEAGVVGSNRTNPIIQPCSTVNPDSLCGICLESIITECASLADPYVHLPCEHDFCHPCIAQFLGIKIREGVGYARRLPCPGFKCSLVLDRVMILDVVKPDLYEKYLELMDLCYVKDHPRTIRYCPYPDCPQAVMCQHDEDDDFFDTDEGILEDLATNGTDSLAPAAPTVSGRMVSSLFSTKVTKPQQPPKQIDARTLHYPITVECTPKEDTVKIVCDAKPFENEDDPANVMDSTHPFCFRCLHQEDHSPSPCELLKLWLSKEVKDSATFQWLQVNSKDCPFCDTPVQKNGGCNRISCKCGKEFCWTCLKKWHGYDDPSCNAFVEPPLTEQAQSVRVDLERYLHYLERYKNHDSSIRLSQQWVVKTEKKMARLQSDGTLSFIEVQFLCDALRISVRCRQTLKFTYVVAFYLSRASNHTHLFEANQNDLEKATESLSDLIERPAEEIPSLKTSVMDRMKYCEARRAVLEEDFLKGLREGRWIFTA